ncbi:aldo/keto reductase [Kitasatospora sp. NPDC088783]|uniref:aldo/keto reductase n=1 Tax=Kitasatospora sp. NPDC088783 TaxID=3364077 RepID=UPI0038021627
MENTTLGTTGPSVSRLGLGLMGMSGMYGPADRAESIATVHAALDRGVTLLDTGDFYGMGHNEMLLQEALRGRDRERAVISVKFGALRDADGAFHGVDLRPAAIRNFVAYSLQRLGTDHIDVYRPARISPEFPIEDVVGTLAELVEKGWIRHIGLSEVSAETLRRAHAVHPITDVQIEYSLISRGIEQDILPTADELGVAVTAYGVLSRGLISGHWKPQAAAGDFRAHLPRFSGDALDHNLALVEALRAIAEEKRVTVAQLAIAWVLGRGDGLVPLIGARRRDRLDEALGALDVTLTPADLAAIEAAVPADAARGERYDPAQMAMLDSER